MRLSGLALAACLLLSPLPAWADEADCTEITPGSSALARSYMENNGNDDESFTFAGLGDSKHLFVDYQYISPEALAVRFKTYGQYALAKQVVLTWPYSAGGDKPYATALERIIHKPVLGFAGPLWWYPDGTAISTRAGTPATELPSLANSAECISNTGKYLGADACRKLVPGLKGEAVFANTPFVLDCAHLHSYTQQSAEKNATAAIRLYFFYTFVDLQPEKAAAELARAASGGDPLANYITAQNMKEKPVPDLEMYKHYLTRAAELGHKAAQKELDAMGGAE